MGKPMNIAGQRFGRLTAVELLPERSRTGARLWRCQCDCGKEKIAPTAALNGGYIRSCGCMMQDVGRENSIRKTTHGDAKHGKWQRLYHVWISMRQRCNNPNDHAYKDYGGRGIRICTEWNDYKKIQAMGDFHRLQP